MGITHNSNLEHALHDTFVGLAPAFMRVANTKRVFLCREQRYGDSDIAILDMSIYADGQRVITFKVREFPGCCGSLILFYRRPFAGSHKRNTAYARLTLKLQELAAKAANYTNLLATAVVNSADTILYEKAKWFKIDQYKNFKTGNTVVVYSKVLPHKEKKKKPALNETA